MLTDFTFKDTGISVKIKKMSPMVVADIAAVMPDPEPPEQEVDYGEPRGRVMEKNYSDPGYLADLKKHKEQVFRAMQRMMIRLAVVVEGEEWKGEVQKYRDFLKETTGGAVDEPDDLVLYVLRICVGTEEDLEDLMNAIMKRSQPTQEEIERAKSSFRGQIPR